MLWGVRPFFTALAFLSCVPVKIAVSAQDLARSLGYFPAAGFVLGFLASIPVWLGCFSTSTGLQGVAYTACMAALTRGLHWDGLADVCDAAGSGAHGGRFYEILKDSRLGAFGAMGLVFTIFAYCLAVSAMLDAGRGMAPLWLAPFVGRSLPAFLLWRGPVREGAGLARLLLPGVTGRLAVVHLVCACLVLILGLGVMRALFAVAAVAAVLVVLLHLARREQGLNGDFLGTAIVLGELGVLLAAC